MEQDDHQFKPRIHFTDGGREASGFKGQTGDCVVRAIAIATEKNYRDVYNDLARLNKKSGGKRSCRNGVSKDVYGKYLNSLGWAFYPTMRFGEGCTVHLREDELPKGRIIVGLSKHLCAVIGGVIHDMYDPSRRGTRCVYGYWYKVRPPKGIK